MLFSDEKLVLLIELCIEQKEISLKEIEVNSPYDFNFLKYCEMRAATLIKPSNFIRV